MIPIPPSKAIAMAMRLSVTVSMGELTCHNKECEIERLRLFWRIPEAISSGCCLSTASQGRLPQRQSRCGLWTRRKLVLDKEQWITGQQNEVVVGVALAFAEQFARVSSIRHVCFLHFKLLWKKQ